MGRPPGSMQGQAVTGSGPEWASMAFFQALHGLHPSRGSRTARGSGPIVLILRRRTPGSLASSGSHTSRTYLCSSTDGLSLPSLALVLLPRSAGFRTPPHCDPGPSGAYRKGTVAVPVFPLTFHYGKFRPTGKLKELHKEHPPFPCPLLKSHIRCRPFTRLRPPLLSLLRLEGQREIWFLSPGALRAWHTEGAL